MNFYTKISIPNPSFTISYDNKILLLGSCFTENMGERLKQHKFNVDINPFGTLYNPFSIKKALHLLFSPRTFTQADLFQHAGMWHSFDHHSRFSSSDPDECLKLINNRIDFSANKLRQTRRIVITFGTAYVYRFGKEDKIVANCHKLPEKMFIRKRASVEEIVSEWKEILDQLFVEIPDMKILFTVSPIRHWRDGAHANQLSKATLLLAIDRLHACFPGQTNYFPAYEIMMDELRDYRFYASDMIHPSEVAIDYIWERLIDNHLSSDTRLMLNEWQDILKAINHKPFQPQSEASQCFIHQTLLKLEQIQRKFPSFDIDNEKKLLESKLLRS